MLSLFPSLLSYNQLSPLLIRLALGIVLIYQSYRALRGRDAGSGSGAKAVGLIEGIAGILLIIGLWTQAAALFAAVDLIIRLIVKMGQRAFLSDGVNYYLLLLAMALSLLFTGAGFLAFDMPL